MKPNELYSIQSSLLEDTEITIKQDCYIVSWKTIQITLENKCDVIKAVNAINILSKLGAEDF